jgi:hypothetical protein
MILPKAVPSHGNRFASLLDHNFDEAFKNFNEAAALYPDLHDVREIRDLLLQQKVQLQSNDARAWKSLYSTILDKYPWGMPLGVKTKIEAQR